MLSWLVRPSKPTSESKISMIEWYSNRFIKATFLLPQEENGETHEVDEKDGVKETKGAKKAPAKKKAKKEVTVI